MHRVFGFMIDKPQSKSACREEHAQKNDTPTKSQGFGVSAEDGLPITQEHSAQNHIDVNPNCSRNELIQLFLIGLSLGLVFGTILWAILWHI
jgi:hypothetical protein